MVSYGTDVCVINDLHYVPSNLSSCTYVCGSYDTYLYVSSHSNIV